MENEKEKQPIDIKIFTKRLRDVREMLGLTQKEVAEQSGISSLNVSRMEISGKGRADVLFQLIAFYSTHISIDILLDNKAWFNAVEDKDLLLRKPYMTSVLGEKLRIMKDHVRRDIAEEKSRMARDLNVLRNKLIRGLDSAISLTED